MENRGWEITFSDMLMLTLTFFVFMIAVSNFKSHKYEEFWKEEPVQEEGKTSSKSFKFKLIEGLKMPSLSREAEEILLEVEDFFEESDFSGMDVNYTESKISLMVSESLSFNAGQFQLDRRIQPLVLRLIPAIKRSGFDINIEGHTDPSKSKKFSNMELSISRALSVARLLIKNGIDETKVSVSGYGAQRPITSNDTPEGRRKNRRVEINIMIARI